MINKGRNKIMADENIIEEMTKIGCEELETLERQ
jgi:hypothetical protein